VSQNTQRIFVACYNVELLSMQTIGFHRKYISFGMQTPYGTSGVLGVDKLKKLVLVALSKIPERNNFSK